MSKGPTASTTRAPSPLSNGPEFTPSRRGFCGGAAALAIAGWAATPGHSASEPRPLGRAAEPGPPGTTALNLRAAERATQLPCFRKPLPLWTFADAGFPVVRIPLGQSIAAAVRNDLSRPGEHITVHWHGVRLTNDQDGVPYLTQPPIDPGESFAYRFTPPDTGTFFFHTHCNTAEQLGRGLFGVLIVEGDETEPYDAERLLVVRDWRIAEDGGFAPFTTDEGAARAGTFGTVRSVNGETNPTIPVPASADVRLRLLNVDPTRVAEIGIKGAEAVVIAVDGIAVPPFLLKGWRFGPASRIDLVIRTPRAGEPPAVLYDFFAAQPVPLATFAASGPNLRRAGFDPAPLRAGRIAEPDLDKAERLPFSFSATPAGGAVAASAQGGAFIGDLCMPSRVFWAINKEPWPGADHSRIPPPLADLKLGQTYVFQLNNLTPQQHPIHIHGHTWKVLSSNKRHLPPYWADTVVLLPNERIEVAFVADNPGRWMFHCHIIEHQEAGMMGYVHVA